MKIHNSVFDVLFARKPRFVGLKIRKDGDFYLGTNTSKGEIVSLNTLAGEICMFCDGKITIGSIYEKLRSKYTDVTEDVLAYDLCKCVSDLESTGLITVSVNHEFLTRKEV